jgi:thioredoxin reductase
MSYDVIIIGGGPAGLSASLALGRGRKRVLLCDSGPRRNAAAEQIHNFVTRDGTPPDEFRRIARDQLATYANVELQDARVRSITGSRGAFRIDLSANTVEARRVLLCTGMIDEMAAIEGFAELWGHSIIQCPYCHGWELRDRRWGYLALSKDTAHVAMFAGLLRGWTTDVTVFTNGLDLNLEVAGIRVETSAVTRLLGTRGNLEHVVLADGRSVPCEVLFAHPPQRHVPLVHELGLALDDDGYVRVDPMTRETSLAGVYAAGDLTTRAQGAMFAAAAGTQTAAALNMELTHERPLGV